MPSDLVFLGLSAGALLSVGLMAGVLAGLLGVGGGIVIVPALYYLLGLFGVDEEVRMHLAVGTSLATIVPTSIISMRAHHRRGAVDTELLRGWGPAIAVGVVIGAMMLGLVEGEVLTAVFAGVALLVSLHMGLAPEGLRLAHCLPGGPVKVLIGTVIGGFSTMMGIGGGTLTVPTLVLFDYPIRRAVGTASAVGLIIAIPGSIAAAFNGWTAEDLPPLSLGYVNLLGFALIVPATMLAAPLGARLAHSINTRLLRRAFALFLALTALRMGYGLLD